VRIGEGNSCAIVSRSYKKLECHAIQSRGSGKDITGNVNNNSLDFSDVKRQEKVKRVLEIATTDGHNIIKLYLVLISAF